MRNRERGITNPDGIGWAKSSVKKLALRPANAGLRMFHAGRADERVLPAKIEPIITRAEWERLRAIFTDPERRTSKPGARKHLLSWGIGACGVCGGPLRVTLKGHQRHGTKQQVYACDGRGCVGRNQARVDELVRDVVVARLSRDDALDWLAGDDEIAGAALDRAAALRARLSQAADDYADDSITADQLRRITAKIKPQIEEAEREAADARPDVPMGLLRQVAGGVARERWDAFDVSQRRALVAALIEQVVILPVNRRGPGFDPATVEFHWRTGAENN